MLTGVAERKKSSDGMAVCQLESSGHVGTVQPFDRLGERMAQCQVCHTCGRLVVEGDRMVIVDFDKVPGRPQ